MTTTASAHLARDRSGLTFGGILNSEWIKLRSLRSTAWCYAIVLILSFGLGLLLAASLGPIAGAAGVGTSVLAVQIATTGIGFTQLVVSVLGALVITGEYSTGMIRSTITAVPTRLPALVAKSLVFGVVTFAVGLVSIVGTALITAPLLSSAGVAPDFGDGKYLLSLLGGAGFLALVGVLALSLGAIIRNSAGGIAAALGLTLVLPTVVQIFAAITNEAWASNIGAFLPSAAGTKMYEYSTFGPAIPGVIVLDQLQGTLVLVAWVVVFFAIASALLKRRDA